MTLALALEAIAQNQHSFPGARGTLPSAPRGILKEAIAPSTCPQLKDKIGVLNQLCSNIGVGKDAAICYERGLTFIDEKLSPTEWVEKTCRWTNSVSASFENGINSNSSLKCMEIASMHVEPFASLNIGRLCKINQFLSTVKTKIECYLREFRKTGTSSELRVFLVPTNPQ